MKEGFETTYHGKKVLLHTLSNKVATVQITNYGARIVQMQVPDSSGTARNVVFGFDSLNKYLQTKEIYHGAVVGRYANRIAKGHFSINGKSYALPCNNGVNHLHGGPKGFHQQVWEVLEATDDTIVLTYLSPDGEEGFPGELRVKVTYTLKDAALHIDYTAISDKDTVINLTNHAYFNLNGIGSSKVLQHQLQIDAQGFTPVDATLIPTGEIAAVEGTPFDFRQPVAIGAGISSKHPQIVTGNGYDHNFVLDGQPGILRTAAIASGDQTSIRLEVLTTEPGVQLYVDEQRQLFCLETQHFPDSPNQPDFPTTLLKADTVFESTTVFSFSIARNGA